MARASARRYPNPPRVRRGRPSRETRRAGGVGAVARSFLRVRLATCRPPPSRAARGATYRLTNIISIDICRSMVVDLELVPKQKRPAGERCCEPVVYPDVQREHAIRMAEVAKA